jgi:hypothetical protein
MASLRVKLLDDGQLSFDHIGGSTPIKESSGLNEWRGRSWLPDGNRVDPARKHCLTRDDGRAGKMVMDQFIASDGIKIKKTSLAVSVSLAI